MPVLVQGAVEDRLAWQRPKAAICTVLLVLSVSFAVRLRRTLIEESRAGELPSGPRGLALRTAGWVAPIACVLLMLMVIGNVQASIAPLGLTLVYG